MTNNDTSRRRFLQVAGAGVASAPLLMSAANAQTESLPRKAIGRPYPGNTPLPDSPPPPPGEGSVGFAVMGLGGYGIGKCLPALADGKRCHVAAVVSGNPEKAARVAAAYGLPDDAIYSYDDFARIASDDRVEAIYNVLPSGLHEEWTEKSYAAGKHVLCEKPMALNAGECERMIAAAKQADRKLMIAYRCHFEPHNVLAMQLMREGAIGKIRRIETIQQYRMGETSPATNWRVNRALAGGGALEDYGIYGVQATMYLSGEEPVSVSAVTETPENDPRFSEIVASVRTEMRFPSGAVANLFTSYDTSPGREMVRVEGEDGVLHMEPATSYGGQRMTLTRGGVEERLTPGDPAVQFALQCDHFAEAIRDGTPIIPSGEMGLRDVRVMDAIYKSAGEGGREVTL